MVNSCRDCGKSVVGVYLCGLCYYRRIRDGKKLDLGGLEYEKGTLESD